MGQQTDSGIFRESNKIATCMRDCMFAFGRFFGYSSSVSRKSSIEKNEAKLQVLLLEMVELKVAIWCPITLQFVKRCTEKSFA